MKLTQIASIAAGHPFRGKIPEVSGTGIHIIQMKDVSTEEGINWDTCIETELTGKREPDWLKPGDVLFAARGSRNYAVLVDESTPHSKIVAAPHFYILRCKTKSILPEYLAWLLNQRPGQRYFQREAEGTFTKSIRRSVLAATPIAVPGIAKQRSIINLATTMKQEQQLIEQLIHNGEIIMNGIATDLLQDSQRTNQR